MRKYTVDDEGLLRDSSTDYIDKSTSDHLQEEPADFGKPINLTEYDA